jgi:hypothetical protein
MEDPVQPPRSVNPDLSPALEKISLQALSKKADDRFASALDMSSALEELIRQTGKALSNAQVGDFLKEVFPQESEQKVAFSLPNGERALLSESGKVGQSDLSLEVPLTASLKPSAQSPSLPQPNLRPWLIGTGALSALLVGLLVLVLARSGAGPRELAPPRRVIALKSSSGPVEAEALPAPGVPDPAGPPVGDTDAGEMEADQGPIAPPSISDRPTPAARSRQTGLVLLRVNPWAEVFLGENSLGVTPLEPIKLSAGRTTFTLKNHDLDVVRTVSVNVLAGRTLVVKVDLLE